MIGHEHRTSDYFGSSCLAGATALLLLFILPGMNGCDAAPAAAQLAGLSDGSASQTARDTLAKVSLGEVDTTLDQLQPPDTTATPSQQQPPPCGDEIRQLTRQCLEETRSIATACIDEISQLFQNGQFDAAQFRAGECIDQINLHTEGCLQALRDQCQLCLTDLMNSDAPMEEIEALLRACRRAAGHIFRARRAAVGAIKDAVDRGVAQHCVETIHMIAVGCADQNGQIAADCVVRIEDLLANGQIDQALAEAHGCIQQIRLHTVDCARGVQEHCQSCLQRLIHDGGISELVRHLRDACKANLRLILGSAHDAIAQIRGSLPPPPDTQP